jgi:hypothetical protein
MIALKVRCFKMDYVQDALIDLSTLTQMDQKRNVKNVHWIRQNVEMEK